MYFESGNSQEAEAVIAGVLAKNPSDTEALLEHGHLILAKGDRKRAEADAREVLWVGPQSSAAQCLLPRVCMAKPAYRQQELAEAFVYPRISCRCASNSSSCWSPGVRAVLLLVLSMLRRQPRRKRSRRSLHVTMRCWLLVSRRGQRPVSTKALRFQLAPNCCYRKSVAD